MDPNRPFRWDLVRGDRLGTLLDDLEPVDLWYAEELLACAAKVLARSGDGDLRFVGRSADSVFDMLSGCLQTTSWRERLRPLPLSIRYLEEPLTVAEVAQLRTNLAAEGLAPQALARRRRPVVFVDLVAGGATFGEVFLFLRRWIAEERAQWDVIRCKLRFVGITRRRNTSPNTWRWQQHAGWPRELPASAIANVSLDPAVWSWLGNEQPKTAASFRPELWLDEWVTRPRHGTEARLALAEAVALLRHGEQSRRELVTLLGREPAFAEPWLRALALELRR